MRFMVIAAERAATIAMTIHRICRSVGQPLAPWCVARAASSAPVSANGSANTECSNLIISSTVRMRPVITKSCLGLFSRRLPRPAVHFFLWQIDLREDAADVLCDQVVDRFWLVIKRRNRRHDHGARPVIMPAIHAFYHQPKTIDDLVTQYVCRVLAQIDLPQEKMYRWTGQAAAKKAEA